MAREGRGGGWVLCVLFSPSPSSCPPSLGMLLMAGGTVVVVAFAGFSLDPPRVVATDGLFVVSLLTLFPEESIGFCASGGEEGGLPNGE